MIALFHLVQLMKHSFTRKYDATLKYLLYNINNIKLEYSMFTKLLVLTVLHITDS